MISLGSYLGHLLSEVTRARMQADIETLRIAEFYAGNPLLKHFPVPRMRLPNVELNVPVIISETPEDDKPTSEVDSGTVVAEAKKITERELSEGLNLKLTPTDTLTLSRVLSDKTKMIDDLLKKRVTKETIAGEVTNKIINDACKELESFKRGGIDKEKVENLRANIKKKLHAALINLENPDRIKIIAETSKIREIENIENVVTLKLFITEDSVEWAVKDEGDNKTKKMLVPE